MNEMKIFAHIQILLFFCVALLLSACEIINPQEEVPAYLKVESPLVAVDPGRNYQAIAGVKDIWLSRNDDNLGIYPVPNVIPFIPEAENKFTINGGIFLSGFSAFREPYPFWKGIQFEASPAGGDTIVLAPVFEYFSPDSILTFKFEEKFEGASFQFQSVLSGNANEVALERTNTGFDGNGGKFNFSETATVMEMVSTTWFRLPQEGANRIFLEVTYNNTIPFNTGIEYRNAVDFGRLGGQVFVNSEGEWNTVYYDYNDQVRSLPAEMEFRLFFRAEGEGQTGSITLDNIRIVHFQE